MSSIRFLGLSTSTFFMGPMGPGAGRALQRGGPTLPLPQQDPNITLALGEQGRERAAAEFLQRACPAPRTRRGRFREASLTLQRARR